MSAAQPPQPLNLSEYESAARASLPRMIYDYIAGGAEDEGTLRANRAAFERIVLHPRVLVDVSRVDTSVELLGERIALPVLLAPAALQRLAHPEGECAAARAAAAAGTVFVAAALANCSIEETAAATTAPLWFQLYVFRDRGISRALVERAEAAGCRALCVTVDVPVQGKRERDIRNELHLPAGIELANLRGLRQAALPAAAGSDLDAYIRSEFDPALTWDVMDWLRSITRMPIVLKGLMTAADAKLAVAQGAAAVIVSNHGGRQLDGAEPAIRALPRVVDAVAGAIPVLVDGGVRRGSDVLKALALGAHATLIGRPYLWGLAVAGQQGVERVLALLRDELERALALAGCPDARGFDRSIASLT